MVGCISWPPVSRKGLFGGQQWLVDISRSPVSRKGLFGDRRRSVILAGHRCPVKGSLVASNGWVVLAGHRCPVKGSLVTGDGVWLINRAFVNIDQIGGVCQQWQSLEDWPADEVKVGCWPLPPLTAYC